MKLLLVGINSRYTHSNPALYYLDKYINDLNYEVFILEYTTREKADSIVSSIMKHKPDVVAFSVYIWNSSIIADVIGKLKSSSPHVKIVTGGPEVSYEPEVFFDKIVSPDYIVCGYGEEGFRSLALSGFDSAEKIIHKKNPSFNLIPFPYNDVDMESLKNRFIYYESSRGCPFSCTYCLSSRQDHSCEYRNLTDVKNEIDYLCSFKPVLVKFVDRTFNSKRDHYRGIWEHLTENHSDSKTRFHFEIYPELLTDDDILFLKSIPHELFQFEMGIQSTRNDTLAAVNRKGNWQRIFQIIKTLGEYGNIHLHVDLIAGLPFESYIKFKESYNRVYALKAEHFQSGFLKVLPGTKMRDQADEYLLKYSLKAPYEIMSNRWISEIEMTCLKRISFFTDLIRNSGRFKVSEKLMLSLYRTPFDFYEALAKASADINTGALREWESIASLIVRLCEKDFPHVLAELMDSIKWDWCLSMKSHYYPNILKSDLNLEAKRDGYKFFIEKSSKNIISFNEFTFTQNELKRSVFFRPETDIFRDKYMSNRDALILPDKRIVFFNSRGD
ncbi:MAG: DUF4080 domain-containing protein [Spirochaetota bacterium]